MKKLFALCIALVLALSMVSFAVAENATYKIGILTSTPTHDWASAVIYNINAHCQALGIEYNVTTANNIEEMTAQVSDQLTWGAQAIVVCAQWEGYEDPIGDVIAQGIPVVAFDLVLDVDGIYAVAGNNYGMGTLSADYIVSKIGTTGTVVALPVPTSGNVSDDRMKGFTDRIAEIAPEMVIKEYATEFNAEAGLRDMSDILMTEDHIDAVYSLDDETSIGAIQAITEAGRNDIKVITGGGGSQKYFKMMLENETGLNIASALYSPAMVNDAIDMALAILKGEAVESPYTIPTAVVDRDNVADYLNEASPY